MAGNIGLELNLAVDEIHCVSKKFIPSKFDTCIKNSRRLHLLKHTMFLIVMITMATLHSTCEQRCYFINFHPSDNVNILYINPYIIKVVTEVFRWLY